MGLEMSTPKPTPALKPPPSLKRTNFGGQIKWLEESSIWAHQLYKIIHRRCDLILPDFEKLGPAILDSITTIPRVYEAAKSRIDRSGHALTSKSVSSVAEGDVQAREEADRLSYILYSEVLVKLDYRVRNPDTKTKLESKETRKVLHKLQKGIQDTIGALVERIEAKRATAHHQSTGPSSSTQASGTCAGCDDPDLPFTQLPNENTRIVTISMAEYDGLRAQTTEVERLRSQKEEYRVEAGELRAEVGRQRVDAVDLRRRVRDSTAEVERRSVEADGLRAEIRRQGAEAADLRRRVRDSTAEVERRRVEVVNLERDLRRCRAEIDALERGNQIPRDRLRRLEGLAHDCWTEGYNGQGSYWVNWFDNTTTRTKPLEHFIKSIPHRA